MEVPRLGVESELQLQATATQDPSFICNPHHSSWQRWVPDPLSEARDRMQILTGTSWIHFCCPNTGTPRNIFIWVDINELGEDKNFCMQGIPIVAQWLMNPIRNHEVVRPIPGLAQWVADSARIPCCCGSGIGWWLRLQLDP